MGAVLMCGGRPTVGHAWDDPADAPVLSMGSASSTNTRTTASFYLTPLPPGPLSIVIAWPAIDLAEHRWG